MVSTYNFMLMELYDVGGTWTRGALAKYTSFTSKLTFFEKIKERTEEDFCAQILRMSPKLRKTSKPSCVSVAVPGPVEGSRLLKVPQLGIKDSIDVAERLEPLKRHVYVENDMNAAAHAELAAGYGNTYNNFYLLTFSTGIGAGIVLNRTPLKGKSGEFGHNVLGDTYTHECGCGNYGCWGALCSGKGIENLLERYRCLKMSAEEFFSQEPEKIKGMLELIHDYNAKGIGTMINSLEVDAIIVMGSLGLNQFDKIIPSQDEIKRYTINPIPPIIPTKLGEDIGLIGAFYSALFKKNRRIL